MRTFSDIEQEAQVTLHLSMNAGDAALIQKQAKKNGLSISKYFVFLTREAERLTKNADFSEDSEDWNIKL